MKHNPATRLILLASGLMLLLSFALYGVHPYLGTAAFCGLMLMLLGFFCGWHIGFEDGRQAGKDRRIPIAGRNGVGEVVIERGINASTKEV